MTSQNRLPCLIRRWRQIRDSKLTFLTLSHLSILLRPDKIILVVEICLVQCRTQKAQEMDHLRWPKQPSKTIESRWQPSESALQVSISSERKYMVKGDLRCGWIIILVKPPLSLKKKKFKMYWRLSTFQFLKFLNSNEPSTKKPVLLLYSFKLKKFQTSSQQWPALLSWAHKLVWLIKLLSRKYLIHLLRFTTSQAPQMLVLCWPRKPR